MASSVPARINASRFLQPVQHKLRVVLAKSRQEIDGHWITPICRDVPTLSTECWRNEVFRGSKECHRRAGIG